MGKSQKKYGKGRLDHYYRLAKEKGYRARSSFKIVQLNQKYNFFKPTKPGKPMCVIDLCAAPGSWCQVATQCCPLKSLIVGVDLAPIKALPNVITFQSDITTDHCRSQLRGYLKTWKADVVMHDGAPNVGMAWAQDAFTQSELVLQSLKLAVEFLAPGGWFVTKVFRSKDYNKLMWVFNQFFEKCEATKPPASRNVSAEIFVVCRGFKAPQKIDPRLLDSKYVFEDLQENGGADKNHQAKVYNPEKKMRKREGYDEGDYMLFHRLPALEFITNDDPIRLLSENNEFTFDTKDPNEQIQQIKKLPQTNKELLEMIRDLKVLGRKDFRVILKWRLAARRLLGIDGADSSESEAEPELTTEEQIDKEIDEVKAAAVARAKRERRRRNETRQKEIQRMQMHMGTPADIGIEAGNLRDSLFDLDRVRLTGQAEALVQGKQQGVVLSKNQLIDQDVHLGSDVDVDELDDLDSEDEPEEPELKVASDDEDEHLALELDAQYEQFKELQQKSAEARALKARQAEEWHGIESADSDSDLEDAVDGSDAALSSKASMFFDDPVFQNVSAPIESDSGDSSSESEPESESDSDSEAEPQTADEEDAMETEESGPYDPTKTDDPEAAIIRMTLAHKLALGQITKHDLVNEGYNAVSFRDKDGLPSWFVEDEERHTKLIRPVTKEAAAAAREQMKALNARPIKKVAEAHARKKYRAQKRLEKIRKKSDLIVGDETKSEREKSDDIAKLMRRAKSKTKPKVTVVAARGVNKSLKGRPRGVKGKYKMVDGTMKKEMRAVKRIQKKRK